MRKLGESEPQIKPSPFVLINGDGERRLGIGESFPLSTTTESQTRAIGKPTTLQVQPDHDHITLIIVSSDFYRQRAEWGMISKGSGNGRKEFGTTFTVNAFTAGDGRECIIGTCVYFDEQNLRLVGNGWTLEYRPSF